MDVDGRIAVVTGAGSGLGRFLALGLADAGAGVVVADLDPVAAAETAGEVRARGLPGHAVTCDVGDPDTAPAVIAAAAALGGPHILINNAGAWTAGEQQWPGAQAAAWGATLDLNLRAPMLLSQLALAPMARLGGGAIVNVASSAGLGRSGYGSPEYAAAKAGLIRFTSAMSGLQESHRVRMTCVVPGWIGLARAHAEVAGTPAEQQLIPPERLVALILGLIRNGCSGTVVELLDGAAA